MYDLNDTIVAVSSPTSDQRVILRITGPQTLDICRVGFSPPIEFQTTKWCAVHTLHSGSLAIDDDLVIDAKLYLFRAPHSYTGDDVAEIHVFTNRAVTEALLDSLLSRSARIRMAGPGEFTARAYLNGKLDLAQAEAVNEIIVSSNEYQLAAAEKLLDGRLGRTASELRDDLMECLSLIEAGLDFSGEEIEFISRPEAVERLEAIRARLEGLLADSISCESLVDLPAVGIAGAPNAGKSSLLNRLLGTERSIVSSQLKTTRDVLTGVWSLPHCDCVLFDCAGLLAETDNILDELAQEAAVEALRNSSLVIFCVDLAKGDWDADRAAYRVLRSVCSDAVRRYSRPICPYGHATNCDTLLVPVATKCDLIGQELLSERLAGLNNLFGEDFVPVSSRTGAGVERLRAVIDKELARPGGTGFQPVETRPGWPCHGLAQGFETSRSNSVALTARHKNAVSEAIENVRASIEELKAGNDEVVGMMMRAAYQAVCDIESSVGGSTPVDEQVLERIFSTFCIGK